MSEGEESFPQTAWSLVARAGNPQSCTAQREALTTIVQRYLPALRAHLLTRRFKSDEVDDLLQSFIADRVLEDNLLARAEKARGKFRSFLLTALQNYLFDEFRRRSSQRRHPSGRDIVSLDAGDATLIVEPSDQFNLEWARQVLLDATRRLEAHCMSTGRSDLWTVFTVCVYHPNGEISPDSHESIARQLDLPSVKSCSNLVITAKRAFARMLRQVVSEYTGSDEDVEEEIRELRATISRTCA